MTSPSLSSFYFILSLLLQKLILYFALSFSAQKASNDSEAARNTSRPGATASTNPNMATHTLPTDSSTHETTHSPSNGPSNTDDPTGSPTDGSTDPPNDYDYYDYDYYDYDYYGNGYWDYDYDYYFGGLEEETKEEEYEIEEAIRAELALKNDSMIVEMGHQFEDLVFECSFRGYDCRLVHGTKE